MLGRVTPTTPLHAAAKKGSISDLKELLSSGKHDVNATLDETGHTALHQAVQFGRIKSVKMLLLHKLLNLVESPACNIVTHLPSTRSRSFRR